MEFFDSHAHYNDEKFMHDKEEIINKIYENKITRVVVAGYDEKTSCEAIEIANKYDFIFATCGISPTEITDINKQIEQIKEYAKNKKVVAIGEIGLDYYWYKDNKELQKEAFIKQIELANEMNLPIVIHCREAIADTLDILKNKITVNKKGVFHCCTLNVELIKEALKLGFYISFAGPITYKNSKNAEDTIKLVPLDKMFIETDSPYLCPEPYRGERNDSTYVKIIAEKIAQIKQIPIEDVAKQTYENASKLFEIDK